MTPCVVTDVRLELGLRGFQASGAHPASPLRAAGPELVGVSPGILKVGSCRYPTACVQQSDGVVDSFTAIRLNLQTPHVSGDCPIDVIGFDTHPRRQIKEAQQVQLIATLMGMEPLLVLVAEKERVRCRGQQAPELAEPRRG